MALFPKYATLAELRSFVRIIDATDTVDDPQLTLALEASSRAVDRFTHRQFGLLDAATEARYYSPRWSKTRRRWVCEIDDVQTTAGLVVRTDLDADGTYETTYAATDYRLWPFNAAADGQPWWMLEFDDGATTPATTPGSLQVTAKPGWTAIPDTVKEGTLIQSSRFYKRRDSPYGVAGSPEMGSELRLLSKVDPDVALMLVPYRRWRSA